MHPVEIILQRSQVCEVLSKQLTVSCNKAKILEHVYHNANYVKNDLHTNYSHLHKQFHLFCGLVKPGNHFLTTSIKIIFQHFRNILRCPNLEGRV